MTRRDENNIEECGAGTKDEQKKTDRFQSDRNETDQQTGNSAGLHAQGRERGEGVQKSESERNCKAKHKNRSKDYGANIALQQQ